MVTYVRAGHTPLIYVPADGSAPGRSQVLIPDGLVVGLHLEGIEEKFAELLEERTLPIGGVTCSRSSPMASPRR